MEQRAYPRLHEDELYRGNKCYKANEGNKHPNGALVIALVEF
jgi:hypothetical protein